MKKIAFVVGLALAFLGPYAFANIFGKERRLPLVSPHFPFDRIGMVAQTNFRGRRLETCTGTEVADRLVLTAAHCVASIDGSLDPSHKTVFLPKGPGGPILAARAVWEGGWRRETDSRDGDWAILLVDNLNDEPTQYLPVAEETPPAGSPLVMAGYSSDFASGNVASVDLDCQIRAVTADGVVQHDCQSYAGASGGPLFGLVNTSSGAEWRIVGVHAAHKSQGTAGLRLSEYHAQFANLGTSSSHFAERLSWLRYEIAARALAPVVSRTQPLSEAALCLVMPSMPLCKMQTSPLGNNDARPSLVGLRG